MADDESWIALSALAQNVRTFLRIGRQAAAPERARLATSAAALASDGVATSNGEELRCGLRKSDGER